MVDWHHFDADDWEIELDSDKLVVHAVEVWEAAEVMWNRFIVRPNKREHGPNRFQIIGRTDAGRPLVLIVHVSDVRSIRVITGWPL